MSAYWPPPFGLDASRRVQNAYWRFVERRIFALLSLPPLKKAPFGGAFFNGGSDGTRTRGLLRDRQAL